MKLVPYWLDTAPAFVGGQKGGLPERVDVAVIGAGLTGISAAHRLAKSGAKVVLFEKDTVGSSASGRNGGMCTPGLSFGFLTAVERYGQKTAEAIYLSYNAAIDYVETVVREEAIDCDFKRTGKLVLACKPAHYERLSRTHEAFAKFKYETILIPRDRLRRELASDYYHGGLADPLGAGMHVGKLVRGLAAAAVKHGAHIHEGTPVRKLDRIAGYKHVLETPKGSVVADRVLLATGSTTGGAFPWFRRRFVPIGSFIIVTEPLPPTLAAELMPTRRMASDSKNLLFYFRLTPDNRMLFGGRARFALSSPQSDVKSGRILERGMTDVFPQLKGIGIDYCWGGLIDMTLDRLPHAGERDGLYYAMGFCGHGTQMATYLGAQMAANMLGKGGTNVWRDFPWPAIPGHFGPPWFLPLVGAYYRLQDILH
jgi:glycine/D-amino acid oxidase-like deaminating enzyme